MNIFFLSRDVVECARWHVDKHVVKMPLETAQLLCTVHHVVSPMKNPPYKETHRNHPCAIWARENLSNYQWLCELGLALCYEYSYRYERKHASQDVIEWCMANQPKLPFAPMTDPPLAMDEYCKIGNDAILSYRNYYKKEKFKLQVWTGREKPNWI